jgi:predicted metal-binding protein
VPETVLYVCTTCRREADDPDGPRAGARLLEALTVQAGDAPGLRIEPVECLSVCKRPCTVAVASAGRWTYVYGDMDPAESAAAILGGLGAYAATPDGIVPWRERPAEFRKGVIARIPPFPEPSPLPAGTLEAAE